jgi:large subunit ribosomal protein L10
VVDGAVVDAEGIKHLATLPGLNELRAMLLGLINAPASGLVRVLAAPGRATARVIDERRKQLEG